MARLVDEPVVRAGEQRVGTEDRLGGALGAQRHERDLAEVHAQVQERVVELPERLQQPPRRALGVRGLRVRRPALGGADRELGEPFALGEVQRDVGVLERAGRLLAVGDRGERDACRRVGGRLVGELTGHLGDGLVPLGEGGNAIDEVPLDRALALDPLRDGAEHVGAVPADLALVRDACQATRTGQHAEERDLGERHRAVAVVDEQDLVAGERQLVAAPGCRAVERGEEALVRTLARVLDAEARLVGELAEVDLEGVRARAEHHDVRAGAEHAVQGAGQHDAAHLGVLEAQALDRVEELDVDAEVVRVQLELVVAAQAPAGVDGEAQGRDVALDVQLPVAVLVGVGLEVESGPLIGGGGHGHGTKISWKNGQYIAW